MGCVVSIILGCGGVHATVEVRFIVVMHLWVTCFHVSWLVWDWMLKVDGYT